MHQECKGDSVCSLLWRRRREIGAWLSIPLALLALLMAELAAGDLHPDAERYSVLHVSLSFRTISLAAVAVCLTVTALLFGIRGCGNTHPVDRALAFVGTTLSFLLFLPMAWLSVEVVSACVEAIFSFVKK